MTDKIVPIENINKWMANVINGKCSHNEQLLFYPSGQSLSLLVVQIKCLTDMATSLCEKHADLIRENSVKFSTSNNDAIDRIYHSHKHVYNECLALLALAMYTTSTHIEHK